MEGIAKYVTHSVLMMFGIVIRVGVGVALFSHKLPRRPRFWPKVVAITLVPIPAFALLALSATALGPTSVESNYPLQLLVFSLILLLLIVLLMWLHHVSVWTAAFCATAGYALQNLATGATELVSAIAAARGANPSEPLFNLTNNIACVSITCVACYLLLSRRLERRGLETMENHQMMAMMPVVSLAVIGFDILIKSMTASGTRLAYVVALRVLHGLLCAALLWVEYQMLYRTRLEQEQATAARLLAEHDRQLRLSKENVEAINIKCHDLRHQIRSLAQNGAVVSGDALASLARDISIYDSSVKTGNEALDTILTEKRLVCESRKITLTCIADGSALDFMAAADIYALFGNALDNAIEAVTALDEQAKRSIMLVVRQTMGCASIHTENYCAEVPSFVDGIPQTSKADRFAHGFGVRSMRQTAERYGGTLSASTDNETFRLDIMIPLP